MIPVGNHGLDCVSTDDYGATALFLQDQAITIDTALKTISNAAATTYLRPGVIASMTSAVSASTGGEQLIFLNGTWALVYSNFTPVSVTAATGGIQVTIPRTGWYNFGVYASMTAVGAVTANSRRTLFARAILQSPSPTTLAEADWRTIDTNTGGEFLVAGDGAFYANVGALVNVIGLWSHTNAASNVQVNIGARIWCHYIGSGVQVVTS